MEPLLESYQKIDAGGGSSELREPFICEPELNLMEKYTQLTEKLIEKTVRR